MNSKGHLRVSIAKSTVRFVGSFISFVFFIYAKSLADISVGGCILAGSFFIAEVLGVLEELLDKR